jgi:hypothetical protein
VFIDRNTVKEALKIARDPASTDRQLLKAAELLVSFGELDEADRLLDRLRRETANQREINKLVAASAALRRSGVLADLQVLGRGGGDVLRDRHEALTARRHAGSKRLIIVFTGLAPRFWLSLMLLHAFLKKFDAHVMYLSDFRRLMFLDGVETVGKGYDVTLHRLKEAVSDMAVQDIHVMGNSAGGFASLRYAIDLGAESYLGMSIRTDLSPGTKLPLGDFFKRPVVRETAPHMLVDLKPLLAASPHPKRIILFCGDGNLIDRAHVEHVADLPNVEVAMLENYGAHDVVPGILAIGKFEEVLHRFVYATPFAAAGVRP